MHRRCMNHVLSCLWTLCALGLLLWVPLSDAQPSSRILVLHGNEKMIDLQPWIELRRTDSEFAFEQILAGGGAWNAASNYTSMHFGYSSDALWMKITLQSVAQEETLWHLYFPYSSLSKVVLYEEGEPERVSGLGVRLADRDYAHRNAVFHIQLDPGEQTTLYLRAESVGSLGVSSQLWSGAAFGSHSVSSSALISLYCGLLLGLGLYHVFISGMLRDQNYLLYGSHLLLFTLGIVAFSGLGGRYLWTEAGEWGTRLLPFGLTAANACGLLLLRNLFIDRDNAGTWRVLANVLTIGSAALAVTGLLLSPAWVSRAIPWLSTLSTLFAVACLLRAVRLKLPMARTFLGGAGLIALAITLFALRAAGLLPATLMTELAVQACSFASLMVVSLALARHTHRQARDQQAQAQMRLETLHQDHSRSSEQVLELTRQLEDANARLKNLALEDPVTGLPNRAALDRHINHALRRSRRRAAPLAVMLIDLDGFKHLQDQLGEATAEHILHEIAARLTAAAREADFVARLGGDEFVLLADDLNEPHQAQTIAERLLDALSPSIELADQSISVGVNIGVTLTHAADLDMPELLRQADMARYARKRTGRSGVSFHSAGTPDGQPA